MKPNIEVTPILQMPIQLKIFTGDGDALAGYCLVTLDKKEPSKIVGGKGKRITTLWHIYVGSKFRRSGYAKKMLHYLKERSDIITTGATSKYGEQLLVSSGFVKSKNAWEWVKA